MRGATLTFKARMSRFWSAPCRVISTSIVELRFDGDARATTPMNVYVHDAPVADLFNFVLEAAELTATVVDERTLVISRQIR
jgi:hypothetical protein